MNEMCPATKAYSGLKKLCDITNVNVELKCQTTNKRNSCLIFDLKQVIACQE